jgi:hypothetical protein
MPALQPRQSRAESNSATLSPLRVVGIVLVIILILAVIAFAIFRQRRRKRRAALESQNYRRMLKKAFPRPAPAAPTPPEPVLPPYEPRREGFGGVDLELQQQDHHQQQQRGAAGSGAVTPTSPTASLRMPPPARLNTPPGYGAHRSDRPAGPLSDAPPAYHEQDRVTWGRSGCVR